MPGLVESVYKGVNVGTFVLLGTGTVVGGAACAMAGMITTAIGGSAMSAIHSIIKWAIGW